MINRTSRLQQSIFITMQGLSAHTTIMSGFSRLYKSSLAFVPKCDPTRMEDVIKLREFIDGHNRLCILTGAGISTESGIPDYRSAEVGLYARSNHEPILYKEFCNSEAARRRYWARNYVGWPRFSSIKPNITHKMLKDLECIRKVECIVTQNVDNLHSKAGSKKVIELHGTAFRVMCLNCDYKLCRYELQEIFRILNPSMTATTQMIRPDGDVELTQAQVEDFNIPDCDKCGGILKPDIVFFGDNVRRDIVQNVKANVENSDALLILGTTLTTFSAYRIVLQAVDIKKSIAIVNIGKTRADKLAHLRVEGRCGDILTKAWQPDIAIKSER
ncbi:NAD-dependent protein deacylase Sirt4 isoform X3 [Ooceraea biroi]|uniref:NAD-dependent ADP-ribosyltransferase sirtuin-4 n=4 Tax=Ooceraea biroi TaxID=2015173 RepID=A0A026WFF3_OOCBI|nr:NAD-dependent protein deacylase Sirt4 isoform X3 [Ooceraea biroi]XP_011339633.1 NAD-dependent protein deacylase Sirt4 isoform X3 [Ooceraea biroi]XP_011339634.1 NAD-dependent protein deacylase Sirt4 isoform X3 [Ooceraea biroi]EZA53754.1 NAD-dependent ADP-ribosyltransferase sirtuin-4 [Ooceraea biroi]